jgi:hypothetical protein
MKAYQHDTSSPKYSSLYNVWRAIKRRCTNPNAKDYGRYGGRGISMCTEWINFDVFVKDVYPNYIKGLEIDRIDNSGNYNKLNCRWVTRKENCNNRRSNKVFEYKGETMTLTQWAEKVGLDVQTVWQRIYKLGWSFEKSLFTKIRLSHGSN